MVLLPFKDYFETWKASITKGTVSSELTKGTKGLQEPIYVGVMYKLCDRNY